MLIHVGKNQFDRKFLVIDSYSIPEMYPEFAPDPYIDCTTFYLIDFFNGKMIELDKNEVQVLYRNRKNFHWLREQSIFVWHILKKQ